MSVIEIYDGYKALGIKSRTITKGEEINMVKEFVEYRKDHFTESKNNHLAVFLETKINNNYPDIVFAEYNPESYKNWNNYRNSLSVNDLKVLYYIATHRQVTSQKIISDLFLNYKELLLSLEKLYDAELIDRKNKKWVKYSNDWIGIKKVEAVEAKICNCSQVMQQAIINKTFASESSILIKRKNTLSDDFMNKASEFGLGLYIYNELNFAKLLAPKKNKVLSNYNSIFINECIGRILNQ